MQSDTDFPYALVSINKGSTVDHHLKILIQPKSSKIQKSTIKAHKHHKKSSNQPHNSDTDTLDSQNEQEKIDPKNEELRSSHQHERTKNRKLLETNKPDINPSVNHTTKKLNIMNEKDKQNSQKNKINEIDLNEYIDELEDVVDELKKYKNRSHTHYHTAKPQDNKHEIKRRDPIRTDNRHDIYSQTNLRFNKSNNNNNQKSENLDNDYSEDKPSVNHHKHIKKSMHKPKKQAETHSHLKKHHNFLNRFSSSDNSNQYDEKFDQQQQKLIKMQTILTNLHFNLTKILRLLVKRQKQEEDQYLNENRSKNSQNHDEELNEFYNHIDKSQEHLNESKTCMDDSLRILNDSQQLLTEMQSRSASKESIKKTLALLVESQRIIGASLVHMTRSYKHLNKIKSLSSERRNEQNLRARGGRKSPADQRRSSSVSKSPTNEVIEKFLSESQQILNESHHYFSPAKEVIERQQQFMAQDDGDEDEEVERCSADDEEAEPQQEGGTSSSERFDSEARSENEQKSEGHVSSLDQREADLPPEGEIGSSHRMRNAYSSEKANFEENNANYLQSEEAISSSNESQTVNSATNREIQLPSELTMISSPTRKSSLSPEKLNSPMNKEA